MCWKAIEGLSHVILRVTGYVMKLAPLAVFCAMAATIATNGLGILVNYAKFMGEFYFGLVCLWLVLVAVGFLILGPSVQAPGRCWCGSRSCWHSRPPVPRRPIRRCWSSWRNFPIARNISSFVLPLGYSFNLDGTMMYCTFASVFIAQAYDIPLSLGTQIAMLLTLMLTSKGVAGVPRASLVVIAATLQPVQPAGRGAAAAAGHRHVPGHGPFGDQRDRQLAGHGGGGEMGRPTGCRRGHAGDGRGDGGRTGVRRRLRKRGADTEPRPDQGRCAGVANRRVDRLCAGGGGCRS